MKNSTITTMGMTYHDEQDEEEDDQFDDCYLMQEPGWKLGNSCS